MLELKPKSTGSAQNGEPATKRQSGRLLMAFALLLVALVAVVVRDRQFWFGDDEIVDSDAVVETAPTTSKPAAQPTFVHPAKSAPATIAKKAATVAKTPASRFRYNPGSARARTMAALQSPRRGRFCLHWTQKWLPVILTASFIPARMPPKLRLRNRVRNRPSRLRPTRRNVSGSRARRDMKQPILCWRSA